MASAKPPRGTVFLLIRHGNTPTTGRVLPGRAAGLHLSDEGRRQAEQVAERLQGVTLAAIYTSPLERARETAAPTVAATGVAAVEDAALLECDTGEWTGESLAALARRKEWRAVQAAPSTFRFPGGESFADLQSRMVAMLERVHAEHPSATVACFTHADPIRAALSFALGASLEAFQRIVVGTGSISAIRYAAGEVPVVLATNSTSGPLTGLGTER